MGPKEESNAGDAFSSSSRPFQPHSEQVSNFSLLNALVDCASDSEDDHYVRGSELTQKLESDPHMFSDGDSTTEMDDECSSAVSLGDTSEQRERRVRFGDEITVVPFEQEPAQCEKLRTSYFPMNLLDTMKRANERLSKKHATSILDGTCIGGEQRLRRIVSLDSYDRALNALRDAANAILCAGRLAKDCGRKPSLSRTALWKHDGRIEVFFENLQKPKKNYLETTT